jgi:hypothetical protein
MPKPRGGHPWETQSCAAKGLEEPVSLKRHVEWDEPLLLSGCVVDYVDYMNSPWRPGDLGSRAQARQTPGYLVDINNIIWMAGDRQEKRDKPIYSASDLLRAEARLPIAGQMTASKSFTSQEEKGQYVADGYLGVMKDLNTAFIRDVRAWLVPHTLKYGVKFEGFPDVRDIKMSPVPNDSAADFNVKDSYYKMMGI